LKKKLTTIDFSQKSVNKAVLSQIFQNPLSLYFTAFAGIFLFANLMIFGIPFLLYSTLIALALGVGSFFVNLFFRKDSFASKYINKINKLMEIQQQNILSDLKQNLAKYKSIKGLKNYSEQAVKQFEKMKSRFSSFKKLLADKYDSRELTYARFLGTAEQLYLSTLDNLTNIANSLESVSTIDIDYLEERFKHLNSLQAPQQADKREIETLKKRQNLRKQQLEKVNELLTLNEESMTQIDLSMATISETKTKLGRASMDMETARVELQELIRRTEKYSI